MTLRVNNTHKLFTFFSVKIIKTEQSIQTSGETSRVRNNLKSIFCYLPSVGKLLSDFELTERIFSKKLTKHFAIFKLKNRSLRTWTIKMLKDRKKIYFCEVIQMRVFQKVSSSFVPFIQYFNDNTRHSI